MPTCLSKMTLRSQPKKIRFNKMFDPSFPSGSKKLVTTSPFCTPFPYLLLIFFHDVHGHKVCDINFFKYMMV